MTVPDPFPTVTALAGALGAHWAHYAQAAERTVRTEGILHAVFSADPDAKRLLDPDSSLVLCGSFARHEMVPGSDCDWTLLINGVVNNQHAETARMIGRTIEQAAKDHEGIKSPGTGGTFGNLAFSHDLVHRIGGRADSNENLTRRMLLLLESRPLSLSPADESDNVWKAVLRAILQRYFEEDVHFRAGVPRVPRFLLNDLTRYWRTITVDYAAKYHEQDGKKWAVRNAKLRFSRKLLFAAGLAFCFDCRLSPPESPQKGLFGVTEGVQPYIDLAMTFAETPPLEYLARFVKKFVADPGKSKKICERIFGAYDTWLGLLGDDSSRRELEQLSHRDAGTNEVFQEVRVAGSQFASGLRLLFFNRDDEEEKDEIAKLSLDYIGF